MGVEQRAAFHAALGDPVRLTIVDSLFLTDLSSGDLARRLGLLPNLLAHHLRVLESTGIIERHRSEGDGRRSYVRLRSENPMLQTLDLAAPIDEPMSPHREVAFVCTHNSARSQLAASAWQAISDVPVKSAGTHPAARVHPGAVRVAHQHGLEVAGTVTRHYDDVVTPDDLVVAVCDQVHEELPAGPRLHWSIPDPVRRGSAADFEAAFQDIVGRVGQLAAAIDPTSS